jgi:phage-related protein
MKPIEWTGSSLEAVRSFPETARQQVGYQLYRVQIGFDPADWKPMNGIGTNVREIRIHVRDEYRVIYVATFEESIYVLHAFQKKTRKTTKRDLSLATSRLTEVIKKRKGKKT